MDIENKLMVTREEREEREGQDKDRALRGTNWKKKKKRGTNC